MKKNILFCRKPAFVTPMDVTRTSILQVSSIYNLQDLTKIKKKKRKRNKKIKNFLTLSIYLF